MLAKNVNAGKSYLSGRIGGLIFIYSSGIYSCGRQMFWDYKHSYYIYQVIGEYTHPCVLRGGK